MDRHEEIKASYKSLGKGCANMYDGIITRSTLPGKLMDSLIRGLNAENAENRAVALGVKNVSICG